MVHQVNLGRPSAMKTRAVIFYWVRLAGINVAVLLCSVATGIITARSIEVAMLGLLTIIQGVVRLLDGVIGLQSYGTLIKMGTSAIAEGRKQEFIGLVKASVFVEMGSQLVAFAVALVTFAFVGSWLGLTEEASRWGLIYACGMVLHATGSPLAILRIFDKFFLGTLGDVCGAVLRLSWTIGCALFGARPLTFLMGWLAAEVIANLLTIALAWHELRKRSFGRIFDANAFGVIRQHREFWPTIASANASATLRLTTEHGDVVLIGALFGATAAAYLRIAKTISAAILQLAWPIHYVLGPTITRYWTSGKFNELYAAFVSFYFLGPTLIVSFYGPNYASATGVTTVYVFAYSLTIVGSTIAPTIFAMGKPMYYTYIHLTCVIVFSLSVYLLLPHLGILSTGIGHAIYQTMWLIIGYVVVFSAIARAQKISTT
jgi:O-antigen/teichoic acid export membrane protein